MVVYFLSLGCDKNLCDAEHMLSLLQQSGYSFTDDEAKADVIVVNSCCFIGDAKKESIQEILRLSEYKTSGVLKALIVTGCLSERYQDEFMATLPEVDGILGISSWDRIVEVTEMALRGEKPCVFDDKDRLCETQGRVVTTGGHYAFLKIAEGCNKNCTYCAIPGIRGHYRSYPVEALVKEAENLVKIGAKELILVAQETTVYGVDLYGEKSLIRLCKALCEIEGLRWIRLLYCYPEEITDELIAYIKEEPKVVKYLDMPVQHASDRILKRMNRKTTRKEIKERIRSIRKAVPGITLRTTVMTGFPGETEKDFEELLSFVKSVKFDRLGAFSYSKEEGTPAAKLKDQIPKRLKDKRKNAVMREQKKISEAKNFARVGKKFECMIEGRVADEENLYVGRTYMDAPDVDGYVFVHSARELLSGEFVRVRITDASSYDLIGEIVS